MKILLIILCTLLLIYIIYKLCVLKYEILFWKGTYRSGNEPVYFAGDRIIEDEIPFNTIRNEAVLTKSAGELCSFTYSKYKVSGNSPRYIVSYKVYRITDKTDVEFKNYILNSSKNIEETLSFLIKPIKIDNVQEYLYYTDLFKDIKTYRDIENYHNTLVKELINRYNKLISKDLENNYLDNSNETIKRILNICKNSNK